MRTSVIRLRHGEAQSFFNMLSRPDPAILQARDTFFQSLHETTPLRREGTSLVMDIPDDDLGISLFSEGYTAKLNLEEPVLHHVVADIKITAYDTSNDYSFSPVLSNQYFRYDLTYPRYDRFEGSFPFAA